MVEWLSGQGAVPGEVDGLIDTLTELRLLDDQKFAEQFAEDKRRLSGWGAERIERTLVERGIPPGLAGAVAQLESDGEVDRAVEVLRERAGDLEDERERQRGLGLLARRGFSSDDAYEAIRRVRRTREAGSADAAEVASGTPRSR